MNKRVSIKIKGLHSIEETEDRDTVEVTNFGTYYKRKGKHYVKYEEPIEKSDRVNSNLLKISDNEVELIKRGETGAHMLFTEGSRHTTFYSTPFGGLNLGIDTHSLDITETSDRMVVDIKYSLEVNLDYTNDCFIHIEIESVGN